jgi:hypothetical protein
VQNRIICVRGRPRWGVLTYVRPSAQTPIVMLQATRAAIDDLSVGYCASRRPPRSGLSRSDLVPWPVASFAAVQHHTRSWGDSRHGGRRCGPCAHIASPGCDAGPHSNLRFYVKHLASGTVRTEPRRR